MADIQKNKGGRPKGSIVVADRQIAKLLAADGGVLPLEVLVKSMRELWHRYLSNNDEVSRERDRAMACAIAEKAAPYFHARLASVEHSGEITTPTVVRLPEVCKDSDEWQKLHAPQ
jgi:hypothetical protein